MESHGKYQTPVGVDSQIASGRQQRGHSEEVMLEKKLVLFAPRRTERRRERGQSRCARLLLDTLLYHLSVDFGCSLGSLPLVSIPFETDGVALAWDLESRAGMAGRFPFIATVAASTTCPAACDAEI